MEERPNCTGYLTGMSSIALYRTLRGGISILPCVFLKLEMLLNHHLLSSDSRFEHSMNSSGSFGFEILLLPLTLEVFWARHSFFLFLFPHPFNEAGNADTRESRWQE